MMSGGRQAKTSTKKRTALNSIQKLEIARKSVMKRRVMFIQPRVAMRGAEHPYGYPHTPGENHREEGDLQ